MDGGEGTSIPSGPGPRDPVRVPNAAGASQERPFALDRRASQALHRPGAKAAPDEARLAERPDPDGALARMARRLPDTVLFQLTTGSGDWGTPRELLFVGGNAERILGVSSEAIMENGQLAYALIHPLDRPALARSEAEALASGRPFKLRVRGAPEMPNAASHRNVLLDIAASPTRLADGRTLWDGTVQDVTASVQRDAEAARCKGVFMAADDLIALVRPDGMIEGLNPAGRRMLGLADDDPLPDARALWPRLADGTDKLAEAVRSAARGGAWRGEAILSRPDGTRLPVTQSLVAHRDALGDGKRGRVTHFSTIMRDVSQTAETERALRLASEMAEVELREMGHRFKNVFALISSVIQLSARTATSIPQFAAALRGRVASLAQSHEATIGTSSRIESAEMGALARAVLAPYRGEGEATVTLDGEAYWLGTSLASTVGLVLHELATNAVKYGALSQRDAGHAGGAVELSWRGAADGGLDLLWSESGGPPVSPPGHAGFGTRLIDRIVAVQGGEVARLWNPDGLSVRVRLPKA